MDISSLLSGQNSIKYLVEQYMYFEQEPRNRLLDKKDAANSTIKILSDLDSKLSALQKRTERMTDEFTNYFAARSTVTSDANLIKATANSDAALGSHVFVVDRLAANDTRVSNQFSSSGTDFSSYGTNQTFDIEVAHMNDDDELERVNISVTVAASELSGDNETVLKAIANAVNGAMDQAVVDEIITNEERVRASIVNEEKGVSRLSFRGDSSGYSYRMDFGASALLDDLNINNAAVTSGASGGYMTEVGTSASTSMLNAQFSMDGLTYYRDSSNVTDAIDGVTLKLLNSFSEQQTITVNTDTETVRKEIDDFISAYNDVLDFLRKETMYSPDKEQRGKLASDFSYRNIANDLRNITQGEVKDITFANFNLLYDIGIEADQQGKLSVKDAEKLTTAIETNTEFVSDIFNGSDGIATKIDSYIESFTKTGGTISASKKNLNSEITSLNDRLEIVQSLLAQKEKQYFEEFSKIQETMAILQNQQSFLSMFINYG